MKSRHFVGFVAGVLLAALAVRAGAQTPATTAFTYQGQLTQGGNLANGAYDLSFKLFNAVTAGVQNGATLDALNTQVTNGVFTAVLDFGQQYNSNGRWLDIAVRPAGVGNYTNLNPRQPVTAAPYAAGLVLPLAGTTSSASAGLSITNAGTGDGIDATSTATAGIGISGTSNNPNGYGLLGQSNGGGPGIGVGYGVVGRGSSGAAGGYFTSDIGVGILAQHTASSGGAPALEADSYTTADNSAAIVGNMLSPSQGYYSAAVLGGNAGTSTYGIGVWGSHQGSGFGVYGSVAGSGRGVFGYSYTTGIGVDGEVGGTTGTGVRGVGGQFGVVGTSANQGQSSVGVYGSSSAQGGNGVEGVVSAGPLAYAVYGLDSTGAAGSFAGYFDGNVHVSGTLSKSGGSFKIDHPLDPANQYLSHSFVESPDMMNIYNGNVTTDASGHATITLPDWFGALNKEFRYQLTVIDSNDDADFVQAKVVREVENNRFTIRTSKPSARVSWQVTGIRQDPWANAHRIPVEELKSPEQRGLYLNPELYGMPTSASMNHSRRAAHEPPSVNPSQPPTARPVLPSAPTPVIRGGQP